MEAYIVIGLLVGAILLLLIAPVVQDMFRNKPKERRKTTLSASRDNVRIFEGINNTEYRALTVLPESDTTCSIDAETVKGPRKEVVFNSVKSSELKMDPIQTLITGKVNFRLIRNTIGDIPLHTLAEKHLTYTDEELERMSKQAFFDKTQLEGDNAELRANIQEQVTDIVERKGDFVSKLPGGGK